MRRDIVLAVHMSVNDYEQYLNRSEGFRCERDILKKVVVNGFQMRCVKLSVGTCPFSNSQSRVLT
jgi:hypothetical protein